MSEKQELPKAYDGCTCECHSTPGVFHFIACCMPARYSPREEYGGRILHLARDIRIDFEAKRRPIKGLTFKTDDEHEYEVPGAFYEPEPRVLPKGGEYRVDGWWDKWGASWHESAAAGNPAAVQYEFRREAAGLPDDEEVLYGHVGTFGYLLHISEVKA